MPATSTRSGRDLAERVQACLLAEDPDCASLESDLRQTYDLTPDESREVLRGLVRDLNAELFPPLRQLELILTEGCNLACEYCFEKTMLSARRMPLSVATVAVDLLFDYSGGNRNLEITLFGGEPTMNFPAIVHVTEYAEKMAARHGKSVTLDMTSNGVILKKKMVDYCAAHGIKVLLSIDGLRATHDRYRIDKRGAGTFERALAGLRLLKTVQPWIGVKITVSPQTTEALYDDVTGLYDLGVNQFLIGHATGVPWSAEAMRSFAGQSARLYRWYKDGPKRDLRIAEFDKMEDWPGASFFGCQAGRDNISVSVTGEISPCSKMLALDNRKLMAKLGDVSTGITHLRNRLQLIRCPELRAACSAAGVEQEYQGGCFASNYSDNGDLFQPSLQDHRLTNLQRAACSGARGSRDRGRGIGESVSA